MDAQMAAKVAHPISEEQLKDLSWRIAEAFGVGNFWIDRDRNRRALDIIPSDYFELSGGVKPGEQLIEVNLSGRYYGGTYERGNLNTYIAIARWLEYNLPEGTEIFYGSDSSDYLGEFGQKEREKLFEHFCESGSTNYRTGLKSEMDCMCDFCEKPMRCGGWGNEEGQKTEFFSCAGCGFEMKLAVECNSETKETN